MHLKKSSSHTTAQKRLVLAPEYWVSLLLIALVLPLTYGQNVKRSRKYFPESSIDARQDGFKNKWYSTQLEALQEPSLYRLVSTPAANSYRFLWLRSFHHPIAIRVDLNPDGTGVLTTKIGSGSGGFRPGTLSENKSRLLSHEETSNFLSVVSEVHFWNTPNPVNDQAGTDGSQWIIEGVKRGSYHVVDRWTPTGGAVHRLGLLLAFDLAKVDVPKNEIY
jgi:hypothetical protein